MAEIEIRLTIFFVAEDGEALYSQAKTRPGADCGSDHEPLIAIQTEIEESGENH